MDPKTVHPNFQQGYSPFGLTDQSSDALKESRRNSALSTTLITDIEGEVARVAALTYLLAQVRTLLPGPAGAIFGALASGTGVDPHHLPVFGPSLAGNFLPRPIGYLDESVTGVPRNYPFPAGSSQFIPEFADSSEKGFALQRAADAAARPIAQAAEAAARRARTDNLASQLTTGELTAVAHGAPAARTSDAAAQLGLFPLSEQIDIARRGLESRGAPVPPSPFGAGPLTTTEGVPLSTFRAGPLTPTQVAIEDANAQVNAIPRVVAGVQFAGLVATSPGGLFGQPFAMASVKPEDIQPVNDKAKRNQDGAEGIRKQLVSERADP